MRVVQRPAFSVVNTRERRMGTARGISSKRKREKREANSTQGWKPLDRGKHEGYNSLSPAPLLLLAASLRFLGRPLLLLVFRGRLDSIHLGLLRSPRRLLLFLHCRIERAHPLLVVHDHVEIYGIFVLLLFLLRPRLPDERLATFIDFVLDVFFVLDRIL